MKKQTIVLCVILLGIFAYSGFRIHQADKNQKTVEAVNIIKTRSITDTKNTIYDKYLSTYPYCKPIEINNTLTVENKGGLTAADLNNIKESKKSNILLYSEKDIDDSLNKSNLKDTKILVLNQVKNTNEFDFSIYNTDSLMKNDKNPVVKGEIKDNKILKVQNI